MNHDVYICYDEKDQEICDAICTIFEENNIRPWVKSKDFSSNDSVDKITDAITGAKCFILILSKNSKATNYVITETDIAFSRSVPIVAYNADNAKVDGNLEFILENQTIIPSISDSKKQLKNLVNKTSEVISKPVDKVKIDSKSIKTFEKVNPKQKDNNIKKYIMIAIPIVAALILIYFFVLLPTGQHTTEDGVFSMNMTDVEVSGYKYTVHGESYNLPANSSRYFMNIRFFDKNDDMIFEVNSTADEFKHGVMWSGDLPTNNITHVGFKLTDLNDNILSKQDYVIA